MDRRDFLSDLARYATLAAVVPNVRRVTARARFADDPFQLGVASGDPTPRGGALWTRLAPRPLEPGGGMDFQRVVDRTVAFVSRPDAPLDTPTRWHLTRGAPGIERA